MTDPDMMKLVQSLRLGPEVATKARDILADVPGRAEGQLEAMAHTAAALALAATLCGEACTEAEVAEAAGVDRDLLQERLDAIVAKVDFDLLL